MIHYKSVAFDRDVTVNELTHWSLADLETLKAEVPGSSNTNTFHQVSND